MTKQTDAAAPVLYFPDITLKTADGTDAGELCREINALCGFGSRIDAYYLSDVINIDGQGVPQRSQEGLRYGNTENPFESEMDQFQETAEAHGLAVETYRSGAFYVLNFSNSGADGRRTRGALASDDFPENAFALIQEIAAPILENEKVNHEGHCEIVFYLYDKAGDLLRCYVEDAYLDDNVDDEELEAEIFGQYETEGTIEWAGGEAPDEETVERIGNYIDTSEFFSMNGGSYMWDVG